MPERAGWCSVKEPELSTARDDCKPIVQRVTILPIRSIAVRESHMVDVGRQLFEMTLADLASRFEINGWEGPFARTPEETAQEQAYQGLPVSPRWEVWMQMQSGPTVDSRNPSRSGLPLRAVLWFDDDDGTNDATVEGMAYRLAVAVAAREAHEALEWTRLDGSLLIDPHQASVVGPASRDVAEYLRSAG